eukprot:gene1081-1255_t
MKNIVILISGRGSNMEAVVRAAQAEQWPARIAAVISNRPDALGLAFADEHGIPTAVVANKEYPSREAFDAALQEVIDGFKPDRAVPSGVLAALAWMLARSSLKARRALGRTRQLADELKEGQASLLAMADSAQR